jgi:2-haloacid dehalogenase
MIFKERGVAKLFDRLLFSSDIGVHKPSRKLFDYLLKEFPDICPENITLVDNSAAALASGRELLMRTIYVRNDREHGSVFVPDDVISDVLELEKVL